MAAGETRAHPTAQQGAKPARSGGTKLGQSDLAGDIMGNNRLQGDDQRSTRTQRSAVAEEKPEPDGSVILSFEKMDKDVRARTDLGKGKRQG
jgi:hypothetical protein